MKVYIAGMGKLATELLEKLAPQDGLTISRWPAENGFNEKCIVVHAGSGRELAAIAAFCKRTSSILVELSTGSSLESSQPDFPVVLCANTNILMLKFMHMLERSGGLFRGGEITITESHQASKTSVPGTAVRIAHSLGLPESSITSVRDAARQENVLDIPREHLARHAFHRIDIQEAGCVISMETKVYGDSPYASGVQKIIASLRQRTLQSRVYPVIEFIENGWI